MNHDAATAKLLELAYGELTPREARAVEAHVQGCAACREALAGIRETRALMSLLPSEPPPERGEGIVLAAAREAAAARADRRARLLPRWLWAGGVGAVAAAAVAVVSWQLAKAPAGDALREREGDLLGRAPPAVAAAPAPAELPASSAAERPAPVELRKGKGAPAVAAPAEPRLAKRAPEPRPAAPARDRAKAEAEVAASAEGLGVLGAGGRAAGAEADRAVGGAELADRQRWAEPPAAPPAPAPPPAPQPPSARGGLRAEDAYAMQERAAPAPEAAPMAAAPSKARSASAERKAAAMPEASRAASAPGAVEVRSFAGCPGERRRIVERDGDGRVLRYVREGERRVIEQRYAADGRLAAAFATEAGVRRPLPLDAPGLVRDARDAGIGAPPRCGE